MCGQRREGTAQWRHNVAITPCAAHGFTPPAQIDNSTQMVLTRTQLLTIELNLDKIYIMRKWGFPRGIIFNEF